MLCMLCKQCYISNGCDPIFRTLFIVLILTLRMSDDHVAADNEVREAGKKTTPSMWTLMKDKAMETGVQGVPNIGRARNLARKMFWILVVFGGTGEFSLQ